MPHDNRPIIADTPATPSRRLFLLILTAALVVGSVALAFYAQAGLTLSHYDARAHLVVSRRIVDSLTPGWKQIGAVWLPLPHLINMPLVQWDWAYRTGYPSAMISVVAMAGGLAALAAFIVRRTGAVAAAITAPALILLNPNVLYLQSTPMTEPLLIGLSLLSLYLVDRWIETDDASSRTRAGLAILALALTRYEGWCVAGALVAFGAWGRRRDGVRAALGLAPYLAVAVGGFLVLGKAATGTWFVTSGFFEVNPDTLHRVGPSIMLVLTGALSLAGPALLIAGAVGAALAVVALVRNRVGLALPLVLVAAAALPFYAFFQGHPFRIRYMVPLVVASGALAALPIAWTPRLFQWPAAALIVAFVTWQSPPFNDRAEMVVEAQWETPHRLEREEVTRYLVANWDGTSILASMGALGHYMQEASHAGFVLSDFVHEGNGALWAAAGAAPERYVRWMLVEERAEGGDLFSSRAGDDAFMRGMERVAEGGGVALYRRR